MVCGVLTGEGYGERDVVPAAKLLEVVLQNCRGRVDAWVGPFLQLAVGKLQSATNRTLKDTLVLVVANALYGLYRNAPLALLCWRGYAAWAPSCPPGSPPPPSTRRAASPSTSGGSMTRRHDKKMCVPVIE
ncbi:hypothetical protein Agub_g11259 [Astrephomene gubernaculifera]|uniref:Uncharacterized protein n=1 Tax=Astrephomene gubernaculifera TaxID=47775 RepID=A0AAD3DW89_9CHLO|nr:hypothetical protein Agub_g11259 [Astrephomene gubernaculifera]